MALCELGVTRGDWPRGNLAFTSLHVIPLIHPRTDNRDRKLTGQDHEQPVAERCCLERAAAAYGGGSTIYPVRMQWKVCLENLLLQLRPQALRTTKGPL